MSAAVPHFVRLVEIQPGQSTRDYPCTSLRAAIEFGDWWFDASPEGYSAAAYRGTPGSIGDREPVKVWP